MNWPLLLGKKIKILISVQGEQTWSSTKEKIKISIIL